MKPLQVYLVGTGSWFFGYGIQSVMFAWLVTMVLLQSPQRVGIAQMALLIPATLLILIGGSLADRYGGRPVVIAGQLLASVAPMILIIALVSGQLSYGIMIAYALVMGTAQALVTPARDGLLNLVADGRIQRRVLQASLIQFGVQMIGFIVASFVDRTGAALILGIQVMTLLLGSFAFYRLDVSHTVLASRTGNLPLEIVTSLGEGFRTVRASPAMRAVVIQNCAMGVCFMGSYIVALPILIREFYGGTAAELSWVNATNSFGLVVTILVLLRLGGLHRQGRALLLSHFLGSLALAGAGLGFEFVGMVACLFVWGICGGVAMTMSRTIMQETAPDGQRGRMMAFFAFSFMGSGPVGAIFSGFLVDRVGPGDALLIASGIMMSVAMFMSVFSVLWRLDERHTT